MKRMMMRMSKNTNFELNPPAHISAYGTGYIREDIKCPKEKMKSSELKPCPFCGGEAKLYTDGVTAIVCNNCSMIISNSERGIIKLKDQWNQRPREHNETT